MRNVVIRFLAAGAFSALFAAPALAGPINPLNSRPVAIGSPAAGEESLQTILSAAPPNGLGLSTNANTDQSSAAEWTLATGETNFDAALKFEFAGNANINAFGIWSGTDPNNLQMAYIFTGPDSAHSTALLNWTDATHVNINTFDQNNVLSQQVGVNINMAAFGFFMDTNGPNTPGGIFYSADSLNNNSAQMLAYNTTGTDWVFAFEDQLYANGDHDFNDMVVTAESLVPVPEPGSMMLFGTGLIGLGGAVRRRLAKRA